MGVILERHPEIQHLSAEEKLQLATELWDELASDPTALPVRQDHVEILQARMEHFRQHPKDVVAWEDVKARVLGSR